MIAEVLMLRVAAHVLSPADVVLEAGGDRGELAAALAPFVTCVWSIEADPERSPILARRLEVVPGACGIFGALMTDWTQPEVEFHLDPWRPGSSLLELIERREDRTIRVPAIDAGAFMRGHGVTALVLDIERYEYVLLPRLPELRQVRALVVEWHPNGATPESSAAAEAAIAHAGLRRAVHDDSIPQFPVSGYMRVP